MFCSMSEQDESKNRNGAPDPATHTAEQTQWSVLESNQQTSRHEATPEELRATFTAEQLDGFIPLAESERREQQARQAQQARGKGRRASLADTDLSADIDAGLAKLDPLMIHPRMSSRVLCGIFAVVFALLAFASYWFGVQTTSGQGYEALVIDNFANTVPQWLLDYNLRLTNSTVVVAVSLTFGAVAIIVALIRRRWWLAGQLVVFAAVSYGLARLLKTVLPRPYLMEIRSSTVNSAPSGHTMLAIVAGIMLICAVPHAFRALCAIIATVYSTLVGTLVIVDRWHRPCDVLMSVFLAGALAALMLLFTRTSGMDKPGNRVSSPTVQIAASVLITLGVCGSAYAAYIVWQIYSGLQYMSSWSVSGACMSTGVLVIAINALVCGVILALRQLTASPLSRLGQIGAPPAPPRK